MELVGSPKAGSADHMTCALGEHAMVEETVDATAKCLGDVSACSLDAVEAEDGPVETEGAAEINGKRVTTTTA